MFSPSNKKPRAAALSMYKEAVVNINGCSTDLRIVLSTLKDKKLI
jgi:hypothetical protein